MFMALVSIPRNKVKLESLDATNVSIARKYPSRYKAPCFPGMKSSLCSEEIQSFANTLYN